jgi:hypothetical protein
LPQRGFFEIAQRSDDLIANYQERVLYLAYANACQTLDERIRNTSIRFRILGQMFSKSRQRLLLSWAVMRPREISIHCSPRLRVGKHLSVERRFLIIGETRRSKHPPNSPVTKSVSDQFVSGAMTMTRIAVSASNWAIIAMANAALV